MPGAEAQPRGLNRLRVRRARCSRLLQSQEKDSFCQPEKVSSALICDTLLDLNPLPHGSWGLPWTGDQQQDRLIGFLSASVFFLRSYFLSLVSAGLDWSGEGAQPRGNKGQEGLYWTDCILIWARSSLHGAEAQLPHYFLWEPVCRGFSGILSLLGTYRFLAAGNDSPCWPTSSQHSAPLLL